MRYHCSIDICLGIITHARNPRRLDGMLRDGHTGKPLSGEEVLDRAQKLFRDGYEAMPIGCDHHDAKGNCLGHEEESKP